MPLIEELPTTTATRISHGWAYEPDTGPAKAILPHGSRKRGAVRDVGANRADGSAKQAKIVQARLALGQGELQKHDNTDSTQGEGERSIFPHPFLYRKLVLICR